MKSRFFITVVTFLVLAFFLYGKLRLGLGRYFDVDEMAYLHWTHNVVSGRVPFIDFLSYVPPMFLYVLAPLFWISKGAAILTAGRVFAWVVFVGMCSALGSIFVKKNKNNVWFFFLPGIFLAFLPMPADKLLEIRPDNLAVLISLIGLYCQLGKRSFLAGLFYSVSLIILPKTLPQVAVGTLVVLVSHQNDIKKYCIGLCIPLFLFGVWILWAGNIPLVWYSLTTLPLEVNRIGEQFGMQPDLFFYPNDIYYGLSGWSIGIISNHAVWLIGIVIAATRLVTGDFLIAGTFFAYVFMFMYGYPLRHPQYLIPIAAFIALFASDFLVGLKKYIGVIGMIGVIGGMGIIYQMVNGPKLRYSTTNDTRRLETILHTIAPNAYVLDMVGSTIFYRDPYYVSAVPFGQWMPYLSRPLPSLSAALEKTQTKYIYQGKTDRVDTLPKMDRAYIFAHYTKSQDLELFIRN